MRGFVLASVPEGFASLAKLMKRSLVRIPRSRLPGACKGRNRWGNTGSTPSIYHVAQRSIATLAEALATTFCKAFNSLGDVLRCAR